MLTNLSSTVEDYEENENDENEENEENNLNADFDFKSVNPDLKKVENPVILNINEDNLVNIVKDKNNITQPKDRVTLLKEIVAEQLGLDIKRIRVDHDFGFDLGADSLDIVELVIKIEDELNIEIEDQAASQIATIQDVLDYIENHIENQEKNN